MNTRIVTLICTLAVAACSNPPDGGAARSPVAGPASDKAGAARASVAAAAEPVVAEGAKLGAATASADQEAAGLAPAAAPPKVLERPGTADQTRGADNTRLNRRDRHGALTPMDQGNSRDERRITASIRKQIMGDRTVSFTGKNVKVVTVGSKVTLRGPVKSVQGRSAIEAIASRTTGVTEVDNQLEVKK